MKHKRKDASRENRPRSLEFDEYFTALYNERWPQLREALLREPRKAVLHNPFGQQDYNLDEASLYPVKHLDVQPGMRGADLCASPGGKTLAAIFSVKGDCDWFCNDLSPARVARLKAILHDCVPDEVLRRIYVSRGDASRWGLHRKEEFDRVLVDAPCSGERHLLMSPKELERWSAKGSKRLAVRQHALLCAAVDCLKPGGRVVYSTCSISPIENDGVIQKIQKSRPGQVQVVSISEPNAEPTAYGHIIMPDTQSCGPIYFSVLEKPA